MDAAHASLPSIYEGLECDRQRSAELFSLAFPHRLLRLKHYFMKAVSCASAFFISATSALCVLISLSSFSLFTFRGGQGSAEDLLSLNVFSSQARMPVASSYGVAA